MRAINTVTTHSLHRRGSLRLRPSSSLSSEFEFEWRATGHRAQWSHSRHPQRQRPQSGFIPPPGRVPGTRARVPFPTERPPLIGPLGLTGPVLALGVGCAEVDRGACELRYALHAGPFPESHHRVLASGAWRSPEFFFGLAGLWCVPEMQAALRAQGRPASLCSAQNPVLAALYFALPLRTNAPTEWTDFLGANF